MKNISKRLLSALLAVLMVTALFAAMPVTASAEGEEGGESSGTFSATPVGVNLTLDSEILLNIYFDIQNYANSGYVFKITISNPAVTDSGTLDECIYRLNLDDYFSGNDTAKPEGNIFDYNDPTPDNEGLYKITCPISVEYFSGGSVSFGVYEGDTLKNWNIEKGFYFDDYGYDINKQEKLNKTGERNLISKLSEYSEAAQNLLTTIDDVLPKNLGFNNKTGTYEDIKDITDKIDYENLPKPSSPFTKLELTLNSNLKMTIWYDSSATINNAKHKNDSENAITCKIETDVETGKVIINSIPAHGFTHNYTIEYTDGENNPSTATFSPLNYIYEVLNDINEHADDTYTFELGYLCIKLYDYSVAVDEFIENA